MSIHPEIRQALALANTYCTKPGTYGHRVWIKSDTGWVIAKDRIATPEAAEAYILGSLQLEPHPTNLPILAQPMHISFRLDDEGGWI